MTRGSRNVGGRSITIGDVALKAGVSRATVSRVMNNPAIVTEELRARVQLAASALAFAPNQTARTLSLGRSTTVGAIVPTLGLSVFAEGVGVLQACLERHGHSMLLATSDYDPGKEEWQLERFLSQGVAGVILVGDTLRSTAARRLKASSVPVVTTYVSQSKYDFIAVGPDNWAPSYELGSNLVKLGHRHVGIVSNTRRPNDRSEARLLGALAGLKSMTAEPEISVLRVTESTVEAGRTASNGLLKRFPRITAIMCTSDALAVGALATCRSRGLLVPRDMSITGFDNLELTAELQPPLTTVNVPWREICQQAVDALISRMQGKEWLRPNAIVASVVYRSSVSAPVFKGDLD